MSNTTNSHPLRYLAPALSPGSQPGILGRSEVPKNTKVSRACTACQRRRSKCSGKVPCDICVKHNTPCSIDEFSDERRKIAHKRKVDLLEQDHALLLQLVDTLRDGRNGQDIQLLNLIRSGASLDVIRLGVARPLDEPQEHKKRPFGDGVKGLALSPRHKALNIDWLSDVPLWEVPAKPWTSLTHDDAFVSHLVSLWFTWHHPSVFNWIDRELFIRDMQAGQLDCKFSSRFLVNIMLAEACFYSDYPESFAIPQDLSSKGGHFYHEAKKLLEEEEGRISLPTVQGIGIMHTCTSVMGNDRMEYTYMIQAASGVRNLVLRQPRPAAAVEDSDPQVEEENRALDNLAWGLYNATTASSFALQKPPPMKKPRRSLLPTDHPQSDYWRPYPYQDQPSIAHTNCLFNHMTSLTDIAHGIGESLFGEDRFARSDLQCKAEGWYQRLCHWREATPECIRVQKSAIPGVLGLHMYYHTIIITLFGYLKTPTNSDEASIAAASSAREECTRSACHVADMFKSHRTHWAINRAPSAYLQWATISLFTLLDDLETPRSRSAFMGLCAALRSLSLRWFLAKGILRLAQLTAKERHVDLPAESAELLRDLDGQSWEARDRQLLGCLYPNCAVAVSDVALALNRAGFEHCSFRWDLLAASPSSSSPDLSDGFGQGSD